MAVAVPDGKEEHRGALLGRHLLRELSGGLAVAAEERRPGLGQRKPSLVRAGGCRGQPRGDAAFPHAIRGGTGGPC